MRIWIIDWLALWDPSLSQLLYSIFQVSKSLNLEVLFQPFLLLHSCQILKFGSTQLFSYWPKLPYFSGYWYFNGLLLPPEKILQVSSWVPHHHAKKFFFFFKISFVSIYFPCTFSSTSFQVYRKINIFCIFLPSVAFPCHVFSNSLSFKTQYALGTR